MKSFIEMIAEQNPRSSKEFKWLLMQYGLQTAGTRKAIVEQLEKNKVFDSKLLRIKGFLDSMNIE